ncbi:hypothetical protein RYH80_00935 [Halobaculum sp. MBLA0147]|uniref:hypothetical protein n=1 Tax=Halobaculum sp. MBLA0147 TaxID=3079934 RepID=UPI003524FFE3
MARTRRGLLALLAASTGCLGFGGGNEVTPAPVTETQPADTPTRTQTTTDSATATRTRTQTRTGSPTRTQTATDSPTATRTETGTPTATPTPTPRAAQVPPAGTLSVETLSTRAERRDGGGVALVDLAVSNTSGGSSGSDGGSVTFTEITLRVDVFYEPIGLDRDRVGVGYVTSEFDRLSPGSRELLTAEVELDDDLDGTESDGLFDAQHQVRSVVYE